MQNTRNKAAGRNDGWPPRRRSPSGLRSRTPLYIRRMRRDVHPSAQRPPAERRIMKVLLLLDQMCRRRGRGYP
jgi:hypothetical protein